MKSLYKLFVVTVLVALSSHHYSCQASLQPTFEAKLSNRDDLRLGSRARPEDTHECMFVSKSSNFNLIEEFVHDRLDPYSSFYGDTLTREELGEFLANPDSVRAILSYFAAHDISVTGTGGAEGLISAVAPISTWERVFMTSFYEIHIHDAEGKPVKTVNRALKYHMPGELTDYVTTVLGTTQMPLRVMHYGRREKASPSTSGPPIISYGTVTPALLNEYYNITSNTGNSLGSQSVYESLSQYFSPSDLTRFQINFQLPVEPMAADIGGFNSTEACLLYPGNCGEANLDVQYLMAVSQVTPTTYFYVDSEDNFLLSWAMTLLNMTDPPLVNSISYGCLESEVDQAYAETFDFVAILLAARGVTIVVSSGDDGAPGYMARISASYCGYSPQWPASSPYVLSVGATQGPEYDDAEIACASNTNGVITSGGGFSNLYPLPYWQDDQVVILTVEYVGYHVANESLSGSGVQGSYFSYISTYELEPAPGFNVSGRAYPDVSVMGAAYNVLIGDSWYLEYGTSASAPVVAGMVALVNAARLESGVGPLGWFNPALYSGFANFSKDVTSGDNKCCAGSSTYVCCVEGFEAVPGWDPVTGFGSIDFKNFLAYFAPVSITAPTVAPVHAPTTAPVQTPTVAPVHAPTTAPVQTPIGTSRPTLSPTKAGNPPTPTPSSLTYPTLAPMKSTVPTAVPTNNSPPTVGPTAAPSFPSFPSFPPTCAPNSKAPTRVPTNPQIPSKCPSVPTSSMPTFSPTRVPTTQPVSKPSDAPTSAPTFNPPTSIPTIAPTTLLPTAQPISPSAVPSSTPSLIIPTIAPSKSSILPTPQPMSPSALPSLIIATNQPSSPAPTAPTVCLPFAVADTAYDTVNYATCMIYACPNSRLVANGCNAACVGDQYFILYNQDGRELVINDDGNDSSCGLCSQIEYETKQEACQVYFLHEGCYGDNACSGEVTLSGGSVTETLAPSSAPTQTQVRTACDSYRASRTDDDRVNYDTCTVYACPGSNLLLDGCNDECKGDQFLRLFDAVGLELDFNDDGCGDGPLALCSRLEFSTVGPCQQYFVHEGCAGEEDCSGVIEVTGGRVDG